MMQIFHVVAMAQNKVIGKDNKLPWHFSADLKFFKTLTTGQTVIMGRKTHESIGRPLPNRENFVLSKKGLANPLLSGKAPEVRYFGSVETALQNVRTEKAFIIGGAEIYRQTIDKIAGIYLTLIHQDFDGDAFYPGVPAGFKEVSRERLSASPAGGQENPLIEILLYQTDKTPF
ncbi:MAG TPA: dihydrofolate reductase [Candidatus Omnitrophota bacterium]|nr:dihydrofolate reductase [Candidatus Omnitrophota bacterium]